MYSNATLEICFHLRVHFWVWWNLVSLPWWACLYMELHYSKWSPLKPWCLPMMKHVPDNRRTFCFVTILPFLERGMCLYIRQHFYSVNNCVFARARGHTPSNIVLSDIYAHLHIGITIIFSCPSEVLVFSPYDIANILTRNNKNSIDVYDS